MAQVERTEQVANGQVVYSSGGDFENPLAAQLKDMGIPKSVSIVTVERLSDTLERIGASWSNFTFNNPSKKAGAMPALKDEWATLTEIASLDEEGRWIALNRFARGLGVRTDRVTRTQMEHVAVKGPVGALLKKGSLVEKFLDGVDSKIKFPPAPYIVLEAVLDLSGYPNPNTNLDSLQESLAGSYRKGQLSRPDGLIGLSEFLSALNNWIPTLNGQTK